ncbi:MAG: polyprenyl synthetase family protein [Candidatus Moranbacteria bacterium]|nr:polyprenyl synthetase family protein [Candidatus Moranbacteria bacterium]
MSNIESLEILKKKFDKELEIFFDRIIEDVRKRDGFIVEVLEYVKKIVLAGGKRLRPAFMYYGYLAAGGQEKEKMIKAAISIELIHIFLLIHDDIIDRDKKRHSLDTVNSRYAKIGKKIFGTSDSAHFGNSMAIIIGDMIGAMGNKILFDSGFNPENIIKALSQLQNVISYTVVGESQDIYIEYQGRASEKEVLKMYENKTAKYTIEGPLHLGAILAGASDKLIENLSRYAIPVGIAFQIQDDILGTFGSEKKLGKSVGSDIIEGKQTLLVVKAREKADRNQKNILKNILGKKNLSGKEIEEFRKIIHETGALDYAVNLARKFIQEGKGELEKIKIESEAKEFLTEVADFMVEREW